MTDRIERIWQLIIKASPQEKKEIVEKLSEEDLKELRYRTNPYRKPIYNPTQKFLEFSFINFPRDYERNLMMTTMIGFVYKMATEWVHPGINADKYPNEDQGDFAVGLNKRYKNLYIRNLEKHHEALKDKSPMNYALWLRSRAIVAEKLEEEGWKELENEAIDWCKNNGVSFESAYPIDVPPTQEQFDQVRAEYKLEKGVKTTLQDKIRAKQDQILDFFDYHFKFDPNNHIRCNYYPNFDKIMQEKIRSNPGKFKHTEAGQVITEDFEEYLVPPLDTFASFKNYFEINYEHLRQCTDDIYGRCSFECAVIAREVFDNEKAANEWENKYKTDFDIPIQRIGFGGWTFIDPWKENRNTLRLDGEDVRLAKEIMEKKKEEEKIGRELLKKRAGKMPGRATEKDLPFENQLGEYGTERLGENQTVTNVYETKLIRSRRMRYGNYSTTPVLINNEK
jgi:hypothetical protein